MRKTGLAVIAVAVATVLLVWWLSLEREVVLEPHSPVAVAAEPPQPVLSLEPSGIQISGTVIADSSGLGIADAEVDFEHQRKIHTVRTHADGSFVFTHAEAGEWSLCGTRAATYLRRTSCTIRLSLESGTSTELMPIRLSAADRRVGRVVNSGGAPIEGALVRPHHKVDSEEGPAGVLSNASGDFELFLHGETRLEVTHSGYLTADVESELQVIVLKEAPVVDPMLFSGVVVDEDGHTVKGASVEGIAISTPMRAAKGFSLTTDAFGRFSLELSGPGPVELHATFGDSSSIEATTSEAEVRLILREHAGSIAGRVLDSKGAPVPSFQVHVSSKDFQTEVPVTSTDGRYRLEGIPRLTGIVLVSGPGFLKATPKFVAVSRRQDLKDVDFTLMTGRNVTGVVFDEATAQPLPHANVKVTRANEMERDSNGTGRTDSQGRFVLNGVSNAIVELRVTRSGYEGKSVLCEPELKGELRIGLTVATGSDEPGEYSGVGMKFASADVTDAGQGYLVAALHPGGWGTRRRCTGGR